jgi:hypothetical protein
MEICQVGNKILDVVDFDENSNPLQMGGCKKRCTKRWKKKKKKLGAAAAANLWKEMKAYESLKFGGLIVIDNEQQ